MTVAACGKQRIADRKRADRARKALRERGVTGAHVYRCTRCHAWHVGSTAGGVTGDPPRPMRPAREHRRPEVKDPPGTRYCAPGCGHRLDLHAAGVCLGAHGSCTCTGTRP